MNSFLISTLFIDEEYKKRDPTFNEFFNAFWVTIITMTTVGFGDGYPKTHFGRFILVWACFIGMALITLMVIALTNYISFSKKEALLYNHIEEEKLKKNTDKIGKKLIYNFVKLNYIIKNKKEDNNKNILERFEVISKMKKNVFIFENEYIRYKKFINREEFILNNIRETLKKNLNKDDFSLDKIKKLKKSINDLKKKQKEIKETVKNTLLEQIKIGKNIIDLKKIMFN